MALLNLATTQELEERVTFLQDQISANSDKIAALTPPVEPPPEPLPDGTIVVSPGDNLQQAIYDANGAQILLKDGFYDPVMVVTGTRLKAINAGKARISGLVAWETGWEKRGDVWFKPFAAVLHQHPALKVHGGETTPSERGLAHRRAMIPHLLVLDGKYMLPVHSEDDFAVGTFMLEGTAAKPVGLWANFGDEDPVNHNVQTSFSQYLIKGATDDVDNVELDGLLLRGCANTKTKGALHFPPESDNWTVSNCLIDLSSGEGVYLSGRNHLLNKVMSTNHGITAFTSNGMNGCMLIGCEGSFSAWKLGLDVLWHSGNKFTNSPKNIFKGFTAKSNGGAGLWFDIFNVDNLVDGFTVDGAVGFGVHIEHNTFGTQKHSAQLVNGTIKNVRKFAGIGSGLQLQYNITNYLIQNVHIENCDDGAVYYKKREERGNSGYNTFDNVTYTNNGNSNRWAVQGNMDAMPDEYINMDMPVVTNWN